MPDEAPPAPTTFPLDALPTWQRSMVEAVAAATKSDPAISAMMSLAVLSAAVGRKVVVETDSTMTPPANIWVLVVAGTGQGKTPIFGSLVQPLNMVQSALDRPPGGAEPATPPPRRRRSVWDLLRVDLLGRAMRAPLEADDAEIGVDLEAVVTALRDEQQHLHPGVGVEFLTDSLTPTALVELAGSQVAGIAWMAPEGGFDAWIGGGAKGTDNMRRLNRAWDGDDLRERIAGGTRRVAERACLTMGVMLHESAAAAVLRNRDMAERGYAYRFLVLVPEQVIGGNVGPFENIPQAVAERYRRAVWSMMALPSFRDAGRTAPRAVRLSPAACRAYWALYNPLQQRIRRGGDLHELHGWIEKMCQSMIRVAGLLHLAEHAPSVGEEAYDVAVTDSTMRKAIAIGEFLIPHARVAYGVRAPERPGPPVDDVPTAPPPVIVTVIDALVSLVDTCDGATWTGTSTTLLAVLADRVPVLQREPAWPRSGAGLTNRIVELDPELRRRGLVLDRSRSGASRLIVVRRP